MVAMGGGADLPTRTGSKEKAVILCTLTWPEEVVEKAIEAVKKEFEDVDVHYFVSSFNNGKITPPEVPDGM